MKCDITASIVIYKNNIDMLQKAINSFLDTSLSVKIFLVDNSPDDSLKMLKNNDKRIDYIFNNDNIGFGAGHNIAIKKSIETEALYHIVLNPDVYFETGTIEKLFDYAKKNLDIGILVPKTLYPNGDLQFLCRMLPTPFDFFAKRLIPNFLIYFFKNRLDAYEFKSRNYDDTMEVPFLSGCFMLIKIEVLKEIGLFDENIFMYTEDIDLTRRVFMKYKTIYYPRAEIFHGYERGSTKNIKLFWISIKSSFYYFNKWGWFWDKNRDEINNKVLTQFK